MVAKAVASEDEISAGRFTLRVGVGTTEDDYLAAGVPFEV
jgi:alkanesulfonate monooxygenase SsuD/methylene tetrahydromethanopterin reductase-like flavin-dependent oxidoreductase (luciferase family)